MTGELDDLRALIADASGIVLDDRKDYLLESRLTPLMKELSCDSITNLAVAIKSKGIATLREKLVNLMTTNETSFMRDSHPFEALRNNILPELIASRQDLKTLRIWSAASSTGQEIYSLAMILQDQFPELRTWDVKLLATDIDTEILDRAARATYKRHEIIRGLPPEYAEKFFSRDTQGNYVVVPELRRMVRFQKMNLCENFTTGLQDLILCRNVLIYFDAETKVRIVNRLGRFLSRHGVLMFGATEMLPDGVTGLKADKFGRTLIYRPESAAQQA